MITPPRCHGCGSYLTKVEHRDSDFMTWDAENVPQYRTLNATEGVGGSTTLHCIGCDAQLSKEEAAFFYEYWDVMVEIRKRQRDADTAQ